VASTVGESVAAVAFLDVASAGEAEEIRARIALDPRVREARLVTPEDALARARRGLGIGGAALEGSAGLEMPWVIEVTPRFDVPDSSDAADPAGPGSLTATVRPSRRRRGHEPRRRARPSALMRLRSAGAPRPAHRARRHRGGVERRQDHGLSTQGRDRDHEAGGRHRRFVRTRSS
jgi:hypothetical protein